MAAVQSDVTELNWRGLVSDELTNGQPVIHHSRHRLTPSVTMWLRSRTRRSITNRLVLLAHWLVRQKLNRANSILFSFVTSPCTRFYNEHYIKTHGAVCRQRIIYRRHVSLCAVDSNRRQRPLSTVVICL